jgi:hypothetical protein
MITKQDQGLPAVTDPAAELAAVVERLDQRFAAHVAARLAAVGVRGLNAAQAVLLFRLGAATARVGELTLSGAYVGSNVSYNVAKLIASLVPLYPSPAALGLDDASLLAQLRRLDRAWPTHGGRI